MSDDYPDPEKQTENLIELIEKGRPDSDPFKESVMNYINTIKESLQSNVPLPYFNDTFTDLSQRELIYYAKSMPASKANIKQIVTVFNEDNSPVTDSGDFTIVIPVRIAYDLQPSQKNILNFEILNAHVQINYIKSQLIINDVYVNLPAFETRWFNNYHVLTIVCSEKGNENNVSAHIIYYTTDAKILSTTTFTNISNDNFVVQTKATQSNMDISRRKLNMYIDSDVDIRVGSIPIRKSQWFKCKKQNEDIFDISKNILLSNNEALYDDPELYIIYCFEHIFNNRTSSLPSHGLNAKDSIKSLQFLTTILIEMAESNCKTLFNVIIDKYCENETENENSFFCSLIQCQICLSAVTNTLHVPCSNCDGFIVCITCLDVIYRPQKPICMNCKKHLQNKPDKPVVLIQKMFDNSIRKQAFLKRQQEALIEKRKQEEERQKEEEKRIRSILIRSQNYKIRFFFPALFRAQKCVKNMQNISNVCITKQKQEPNNRVKLLFDFLKKLMACQQDLELSDQTDEWMKSRRIKKFKTEESFKNVLKFCAARAQVILYDFPTVVFETGSTGYQYNSNPLIPTKILSPKMKELECALMKYVDTCTYLRMKTHFKDAWYLLSSPFNDPYKYVNWKAFNEYIGRHSKPVSSPISLYEVNSKGIQPNIHDKNSQLVYIIDDYRQLMFHLMYTECYCGAHCETADAHLKIKIEAFKTIADIINLNVAAHAASTQIGSTVNSNATSSAISNPNKYDKYIQLNLYLLAMTNLTRRLQIGYVSGTNSDGRPLLENPYIIAIKKTTEENKIEIRDRLLHKQIEHAFTTHSDLDTNIYTQLTSPEPPEPQNQQALSATALRHGPVNTLPPLEETQTKIVLKQKEFIPYFETLRKNVNGGAPEKTAWIYASLVVAIVAASVSSVLPVPS